MAVGRHYAGPAGRQMHYRAAGEGPPLILLHQLPGSGGRMEPMIEAFPAGRRLIAPDLAGFGGSDPHPSAEPSIADHADDIVSLADELQYTTFDIYGAHTGAAIAVEIAARHPDRVGRIILDGVALFDPRESHDFADSYCPPFPLDKDGLHLLRVWGFCRDMMLFWPWYNRTAEGLRGVGHPPTEFMHDWVMDVLGNMKAIPVGYRNAFLYPMAERLPQLNVPALFTAHSHDPLVPSTRDAAALVPGSQCEFVPEAAGAVGMVELVTRFLSAPR